MEIQRPAICLRQQSLKILFNLDSRLVGRELRILPPAMDAAVGINKFAVPAYADFMGNLGERVLANTRFPKEKDGYAIVMACIKGCFSVMIGVRTEFQPFYRRT